eukprot:12653492-Prorocentrum_lima.AAC.1
MKVANLTSLVVLQADASISAFIMLTMSAKQRAEGACAPRPISQNPSPLPHWQVPSAVSYTHLRAHETRRHL